MKSLVVYESSFGNTEEIAHALATGLSESGTVKLVEAAAAPIAPWGRYDLLLVGGPTQAFSMSRPATRRDATEDGGHPSLDDQGLREWLERLEPVDHRVAAAAFDTREVRARHLPGSAAHAAARRLWAHGFEQAAPPTTFWLTDRTGPLVEGELERATELGRVLGVEALARVVAAAAAAAAAAATSDL